MSKLSLTQAAKEVGKSKPTISKAIKTGRLSAKKVGNGYEIDPAELFRVYPKETKKLPQESKKKLPEITLLELENRMLKEQLDREKDTVEDLRTRLTRAELLISDHRKSFWQRLFKG